MEEHGGRVHQTRQEQGLQGLRPSHIIKLLDYFPSLSIPIWISPGLQITITLTNVLQAHPLSVQNIGGVFVVLLCGLALAIMVITWLYDYIMVAFAIARAIRVEQDWEQPRWQYRQKQLSLPLLHLICISLIEIVYIIWPNYIKLSNHPKFWNTKCSN